MSLSNISRSPNLYPNSIRIGLIDPNIAQTWAQRILSDGTTVASVKKGDTINHTTSQPIATGLFCQRIFGPCTDYTCACGHEKIRIHYNVNISPPVCPDCHVEWTESSVRRQRLGAIELISPVTHKWFSDSRAAYIPTLLGMTVKAFRGLKECKLFFPFLGRGPLKRIALKKQSPKQLIHLNSYNPKKFVFGRRATATLQSLVELKNSFVALNSPFNLHGSTDVALRMGVGPTDVGGLVGPYGCSPTGGRQKPPYPPINTKAQPINPINPTTSQPTLNTIKFGAKWDNTFKSNLLLRNSIYLPPLSWPLLKELSLSRYAPSKQSFYQILWAIFKTKLQNPAGLKSQNIEKTKAMVLTLEVTGPSSSKVHKNDSSRVGVHSTNSHYPKKVLPLKKHNFRFTLGGLVGLTGSVGSKRLVGRALQVGVVRPIGWVGLDGGGWARRAQSKGPYNLQGPPHQPTRSGLRGSTLPIQPISSNPIHVTSKPISSVSEPSASNPNPPQKTSILPNKDQKSGVTLVSNYTPLNFLSKDKIDKNLKKKAPAFDLGLLEAKLPKRQHENFYSSISSSGILRKLRGYNYFASSSEYLFSLDSANKQNSKVMLLSSSSQKFNKNFVKKQKAYLIEKSLGLEISWGAKKQIQKSSFLVSPYGSWANRLLTLVELRSKETKASTRISTIFSLVGWTLGPHSTDVVYGPFQYPTDRGGGLYGHGVRSLQPINQLTPILWANQPEISSRENGTGRLLPQNKLKLRGLSGVGSTQRSWCFGPAKKKTKPFFPDTINSSSQVQKLLPRFLSLKKLTSEPLGSVGPRGWWEQPLWPNATHSPRGPLDWNGRVGPFRPSTPRALVPYKPVNQSINEAKCQESIVAKIFETYKPSIKGVNQDSIFATSNIPALKDTPSEQPVLSQKLLDPGLNFLNKGLRVKSQNFVDYHSFPIRPSFTQPEDYRRQFIKFLGTNNFIGLLDIPITRYIKESKNNTPNQIPNNTDSSAITAPWQSLDLNHEGLDLYFSSAKSVAKEQTVKTILAQTGGGAVQKYLELINLGQLVFFLQNDLSEIIPRLAKFQNARRILLQILNDTLNTLNQTINVSKHLQTKLLNPSTSNLTGLGSTEKIKTGSLSLTPLADETFLPFIKRVCVVRNVELTAPRGCGPRVELKKQDLKIASCINTTKINYLASGFLNEKPVCYRSLESKSSRKTSTQQLRLTTSINIWAEKLHPWLGNRKGQKGFTNMEKLSDSKSSSNQFKFIGLKGAQYCGKPFVLESFPSFTSCGQSLHLGIILGLGGVGLHSAWSQNHSTIKGLKTLHFWPCGWGGNWRFLNSMLGLKDVYLESSKTNIKTFYIQKMHWPLILQEPVKSFAKINFRDLTAKQVVISKQFSLVSKIEDLEKKYKNVKKEYNAVKKICTDFQNRKNAHKRRYKLAFQLLRTMSNPAGMTLSSIPVLPPGLRPIIDVPKIGPITADLNIRYRGLIFALRNLRELAYVDFRNAGAAQASVQEAVDDLLYTGGKTRRDKQVDRNPNLYKSLAVRLKGKHGRFRGNLLGKRVDYSGRSVIVVGPTLKIHQCGLPFDIAVKLFNPFLIRCLIHKGLCQNVYKAKQLLIQSKFKPLIWTLCREVMLEHLVLLNRAPTLHRLGVQAFMPILVSGRAILLHPLVCTGFNADFDGDQMGVHVPLFPQARAEAWKMMWSRNNFLAPSSGEPVLLPSQDMVLGCYYLTESVFEPLKKKTWFPKALGIVGPEELDSLPLVRRQKLSTQPTYHRQEKLGPLLGTSMILRASFSETQEALLSPRGFVLGSTVMQSGGFVVVRPVGAGIYGPYGFVGQGLRGWCCKALRMGWAHRALQPYQVYVGPTDVLGGQSPPYTSIGPINPTPSYGSTHPPTHPPTNFTTERTFLGSGKVSSLAQLKKPFWSSILMPKSYEFWPLKKQKDFGLGNFSKLKAKINNFNKTQNYISNENQHITTPHLTVKAALKGHERGIYNLQSILWVNWNEISNCDKDTGAYRPKNKRKNEVGCGELVGRASRAQPYPPIRPISSYGGVGLGPMGPPNQPTHIRRDHPNSGGPINPPTLENFLKNKDKKTASFFSKEATLSQSITLSSMLKEDSLLSLVKKLEADNLTPTLELRINPYGIIRLVQPSGLKKGLFHSSLLLPTKKTIANPFFQSFVRTTIGRLLFNDVLEKCEQGLSLE